MAQGHRLAPALPVLWPVTGAVAGDGRLCLASGLREAPAAVICFGFCAFVTATITQEFIRGVSIRKRNTGQDALSALMGMVLRGKRRYGGYMVHLGIVLMFVGFAGTAYKKETDVKLVPGAETTIGKYTLHFDRLAHEEDRQKEMVTGEVTALVGGKVIDHMRPAKLVLPQARERADHRGRDPPRRPPRTSTSRSATTTSPRATRP